MEIPIKMDDLGGKPTIFGNIHIWLCFFFRCWLATSVQRSFASGNPSGFLSCCTPIVVGLRLHWLFHVIEICRHISPWHGNLYTWNPSFLGMITPNFTHTYIYIYHIISYIHHILGFLKASFVHGLLESKGLKLTDSSWTYTWKEKHRKTTTAPTFLGSSC